MLSNVKEVLSVFMKDYKNSTPQKLKIIDAYLFYILLTGIVQFVYCCLVGTFPFNSFLSGFISSVASFVLAALYSSAIMELFSVKNCISGIIYTLKLNICLRLQVNPENTSHFNGITPERAFADFIFAHVVLHLVVMNFIG